jgi:hypothetical protein
MAIEKVDFPETPTGADITTFHDDGQRAEDLQEAMQGERHQDGGQHDLEQRGITSQSQDEQEQVLTEASEFSQSQYPQPQSATFVQDQPPQPSVALPASQPAGQDFQKLYGKSENEKGELRRALKQQMEANQQLLQQVQAAQTMYPQPPQPQYAPPPQPQYIPPQGNVVMAQPQPPQRVTSKEGDEMVVAADLDEAFRNGVEPHLANLHQQMAQMQQVVMQQQQAFVDTQKTQLGITPQIETQLIMENPWLRTIPTPQAYIQALSNLVRGKQSQALLQRTTPPTQTPQGNPQVNPAVQEAARRVTYVERGVPQVSDAGGITAEQRFQMEWDKTMRLPLEGGARGKAQRELMQRAGVQQVSGFRDPTVVTR